MVARDSEILPRWEREFMRENVTFRLGQNDSAQTQTLFFRAVPNLARTKSLFNSIPMIEFSQHDGQQQR